MKLNLNLTPLLLLTGFSNTMVCSAKSDRLLHLVNSHLVDTRLDPIVNPGTLHYWTVLGPSTEEAKHLFPPASRLVRSLACAPAKNKMPLSRVLHCTRTVVRFVSLPFVFWGVISRAGTCAGHVHSVYGNKKFSSDVSYADVVDTNWRDDSGKEFQTTSSIVPNKSMYWYVHQCLLVGSFPPYFLPLDDDSILLTPNSNPIIS
jgi:hypothetical protein